MDLRLSGKVALITGAGKGIGKAIAEEFAKEGAHVSLCARGQAALLSFSRAMAVELAPDKILVNSVCPGFTDTPLGEKLTTQAMQLLGIPNQEGVLQFLNQFLLIKRLGYVEEIAAVVAFLASARASYVTGSVYDVDGGYTKSVI